MMSCPLAGREGRFCAAVCDELDGAHQPGLTNVANVPVRGKRLQRLAQCLRFPLDPVDDRSIRQKAQRGQGRRTTERISRICVAVEKMSILVVAAEKRVV